MITFFRDYFNICSRPQNGFKNRFTTQTIILSIILIIAHARSRIYRTKILFSRLKTTYKTIRQG